MDDIPERQGRIILKQGEKNIIKHLYTDNIVFMKYL